MSFANDRRLLRTIQLACLAAALATIAACKGPDPSTFALDSRGFKETPVTAVAVGTTIRYTLSEAARVVFTVDKRTTGRRVGTTCKKQTSSNRRRPRAAPRTAY